MFWSSVLDFTVKRLEFLYLHILNLCVPPFPHLSVAFLFVPIIFIPQILCSPLFYTIICSSDFILFFSFYHVYHSSEEYCFLEPNAWFKYWLRSFWLWQSRCVVVSCCYSLHFPSMKNDVKPLCVCCCLCILLSKVSVKVFGLFLIQSFCVFIVEFYKSLCIFWVTVSCEVCLFYIIFSSVACFLLLLTLFSKRTEVLNFNEVWFINYFFHGESVWCYTEK